MTGGRPQRQGDTRNIFFSVTSSDSDRNSCMMSLSPITRTEHTAEEKFVLHGEYSAVNGYFGGDIFFPPQLYSHYRRSRLYYILDSQ